MEGENTFSNEKLISRQRSVYTAHLSVNRRRRPVVGWATHGTARNSCLQPPSVDRQITHRVRAADNRSINLCKYMQVIGDPTSAGGST